MVEWRRKKKTAPSRSRLVGATPGPVSAAVYYLKLVVTPYLDHPAEQDVMRVEKVGVMTRPVVAALSAASVIGLVLAAQPLIKASARAGIASVAAPISPHADLAPHSGGKVEAEEN